MRTSHFLNRKIKNISREDLENISKRVEIVDGQEVFFIDPNMKDEISRLREYISPYKEYVFSSIGHYINFMLEHEGFAVIIRPMSFGQNEKWIPHLVFFYQNEWRKVCLQNVYCKECGWKGVIACPISTDFFLGMKDEHERLQEAFELPFLGCPECGGKISSYAIWIDTSSDEKDD